MKLIDASDTRAVERLIARTPKQDADVSRRVQEIVAEVRSGGDPALRRYARQLDALGPREPLLLDRAAIARGASQVDRRVRRAIRTAASHITSVAAREVPRTRTVRVSGGVEVELRVAPLSRVGCYVPGGRNPLVSSLLMTALPARAAGVRDIIVACPRPMPVILYAARIAGVREVLRAGGAHAIAALAYGTRSVHPVDKIVGPGNAYVAGAKALVARDCAIDFYAGPTELVVVSARGNADWIAADLVAQAEHDPDARAILVTPNRRLAREVIAHVDANAPRFGAAVQSIRANGAVIVTRSIAEAAAIAGRIAPEHVACDDDAAASRIATAGTIFVGGTSVPALGDYVTGSNHVLPTAGAARARGGLSAADFTKTTTIQRISGAGMRRLREAGATLARAEGLEGHVRSIEVRA